MVSLRHPTIDDVRVVFVIGSMRTGTTLVAQVLGSHPEVDYLGFELSEEWSHWTGLPFGAPGADEVPCPPLGAIDATQDRVERARSGLSDVLSQHVHEIGVSPRAVVLKNPHMWHRMAFLFRVLPHVQIVRTRRGILGAVASLARLWRRSLRQHERVHHLPAHPRSCWDFVPRRESDRYDADRTFPGGSIEVLAEFYERVEGELNRVRREEPGRFAATIEQAELLHDFDVATTRLQVALDLPIVPLNPPEPLETSRLDEWQELLAPEEVRRLRDFVA